MRFADRTSPATLRATPLRLDYSMESPTPSRAQQRVTLERW
jgi:hypothetical protein